MRKSSNRRKDLDSYIEDIKARQRNLIWPDVLRGGRAVDEFLWKGAGDAPLVQRIGAVVLALVYIMAAALIVDVAVEQGEWFIGVGVIFAFGAGAWFIRNALRRKKRKR